MLQAKRDDEHSPLRDRLAQLKQQLQEQDSYLQSRTDRLIEPDKMADLLRQVLNNNGSLQLVELKTLPVSLLIEKPQGAAANPHWTARTAITKANIQTRRANHCARRLPGFDALRHRAGKVARADVLGGSEFERGKIS